MDEVELMAWLPVIAAAVASLLVVSAPGCHTARALGFDVIDSLCLGPAIGYTYLLTAGMGATFLGVPWSPLAGIGFFVATWAVGVGSATLITRRWHLTRGQCDEGGRGTGSVPVLVLLLAIATVATAAAVIGGSRSPEAIPQLGDTLFHVQAVQLLASSSSANFFAAGEAVWYSPLQYPGGFHVLASTLDSWTGLSTLAASHAVLLFFCAAVWPLSMTFLVRSVLDSRGPWLVAGPLLAVSIQFVPAYFLGTGGPLWSHLASLALLPVPMGCVARVVLRRQPAEPAVLIRSLVAAGIAMCAVIACQPNGLYSMAIFALSLSAPTVLTWGWRWRLAWGAALVVAVTAWLTTRAAMLAIEYPVRTSWLEAALQVLSGSPSFSIAGAGFAVLLLLGLVACVRERRLHGLALAWLACALLMIAVRLGDAWLRVTWPWWSDPSRIIALLSIVSVCIAAAGLAWLLLILRSALPRGAVPTSIPVLALTVLVIAASASTARTTADGYRPPDPDDWWVTDAELQALEMLAAEVPEGSVVAMSPFRGATFISLQGARPVPMGPRYPFTAATALVENELHQLTTSPDVCAAAESLGLTFVITGGDAVAEGADVDSFGIEAVASTSAFPVIATAGPYRLHQVPECSAIAD